VVPTLNEAARIAVLVKGLRALGVEQVIVADGGSRDGTVLAAQHAGAAVVQAPPGRGSQLAAGVAAGDRPVVWVVHADARLPAEPWRWMAPVLRATGAGAFRLAIDDPAPVFRMIEVGTMLRVAATNIPYGDQGMFLSRALYDAAGGYPADHPIMEDVALARRVHAQGRRWQIVPATIGADSRRWRQDGALRRTWGNLSLLLRYQVLGADPRRLAGNYRPPANGDPKA